MAGTLKFDVDKLRKTKAKCEQLADELASTRDELTDQLEALKKNWHTKAGDEFFAQQDLDWKAQVNSYIEITGAIAQLLECAITQYSQVEEEAAALRLKD